MSHNLFFCIEAGQEIPFRHDLAEYEILAGFRYNLSLLLYPSATEASSISWKDWSDWLGTGRIYKNSYGHRPFEEARQYAQSQGLKNLLEWIAFCKSGKKPKDIPYQPFIVYKGKGWISYGDWLGTGKKRNPK